MMLYGFGICEIPITGLGLCMYCMYGNAYQPGIRHVLHGLWHNDEAVLPPCCLKALAGEIGVEPRVQRLPHEGELADPRIGSRVREGPPVRRNRYQTGRC